MNLRVKSRHIGIFEILSGSMLEVSSYLASELEYIAGRLSNPSTTYPYGTLITLTIIPGILMIDGATRIIGSYYNKPSLEDGIVSPVVHKIYQMFYKTK